MNKEGNNREGEDRRPICCALLIFFSVVFYSLLIGAGFMYAMFWMGWV